MANTISPYNPIFYAMESLRHLRNVLGMAARVHRGYDLERRAVNLGDTIQIRKPGTFTAQSAPGSVVDLTPSSINIVIDQFKEVRFAVPHNELAITGESVIQDHIAPAAYALGLAIDTSLRDLYLDIPYVHGYASANIDEDEILLPRKILRDNAVDIDEPGRFHYMIDSQMEASMLKAPFWSSQNNAGAAATGPLMRGTLGTRFNTEVFSSQQVPTFTPGTGSGGGDVAGTAPDTAAGATTMVVAAMTDTQAFKKGDNFAIAGDTTRYVLTADATVATTSLTITFSPPLAVATTGDPVVTFTDYVDTAGRLNSLMFHEHSMAIAFANLPGPSVAANSFTAVDPQSGMSVRAWRYLDGALSREVMVLDVFYGVKVLNEKMAVRVYPTS